MKRCENCKYKARPGEGCCKKNVSTGGETPCFDFSCSRWKERESELLVQVRRSIGDRVNVTYPEDIPTGDYILTQKED